MYLNLKMRNLILLTFENTVFYFLIFVVKYTYYPAIIVDYFGSYQIISKFSLQNKLIIFSIILGITHYLFNELILKKIVINSSQIIYLRVLITPALFYGLKLFNISRILLGLTIISWILIEKFLPSKKNLYVFVLIVLAIISVVQLNIQADAESKDLSITSELTTTTTLGPPPPNHLTSEYINECINTFSTLDESNFSQTKLLNKFYVVGHAYGAHNGANEGISDILLKYFEKEDRNKASLVLTGDVVKESSFTNLNLAKSQIEKYFKNYYISVGNHDIGHGSSNDFYTIFKDDLNLIEYDNFSIVVANFSTYNWQPSLKDQVKINNFLNNSLNKNIIIFSHPVFWHNLTLNKPVRNGDDMLKVELKKDTLDWLDQGGKNIIVISGDYGGNVSETFCEYNPQTNILFIASGIYDKEEDRIIQIIESSNGFYLKEVLLRN